MRLLFRSMLANSEKVMSMFFLGILGHLEVNEIFTSAMSFIVAGRETCGAADHTLEKGMPLFQYMKG